jgi:hypothetical protein
MIFRNALCPNCGHVYPAWIPTGRDVFYEKCPKCHKTVIWLEAYRCNEVEVACCNTFFTFKCKSGHIWTVQREQDCGACSNGTINKDRFLSILGFGCSSMTRSLLQSFHWEKKI